MGVKKTVGTVKSSGLLFSAIFYIAAGLYLLAFLIYDPTIITSYILGVLCVTSGIGVYMVKRWGLWLSLASFPLIFTAAVSTLNYSIKMVGFTLNPATLLFNISLILYLIFSVLAFLTLLDKRKEFK